MRQPLLSLLFVALLGSFCIGCAVKNSSTSSSGYREVVVQGEGVDCDSALKQAKMLATDSVAGSFVESKRQLIDDRSYSERINEFGGGLVRSYNVLSTDVGPPCRIAIKAEVDLAKSNVPVSGSPTSLDLGLVGTYVEKL